MRVRLSSDLPEITPEIFTSGSAIIGIRGSGKTNDGVVLAEQAVAHGVPVVAIDPTPQTLWSIKTAPERFDARVSKSADGCWLWTGETKNGYGFLRIAGQHVYAHRFALSRKLGRCLAPGEQANHVCDVPRCVRPDHLFLGTQIDNIQDMRKKGRASKPPVKRGFENHKSRLSDDDVASMRTDYASGMFSQRVLAAKYRCSQSTIWRICNGVTRA